MNEGIHSRIYQLLQQKGISAAQFADTIGVQRSSMSHLLSGRNKPSIEFLEKCLIKFPDIDIIWLITGKHSLHSQENNTQLQLNVVNSSGLLNQASLFDAVESKTVISSTQKQLQKKSIERIVTFYSDKTFTEYIPE
ncbi:MAG TPA: helix-turn-helix transcriptional regulator [Bacteroidales bacterium]|nr:helix-turn-helix transcriptional regulator [Bacteroidales bacterium]